MSWYGLAIFSLLFMGTQRFMYKVSAERRCNSAWTTFSFMGTVAVLSSILCLLSQNTVVNIPFLICIAFVNSGAFLLATLTHIEALKHIPAGVAYPVIRLNAVIVVIFSIVYFEDSLSPWQVVGIALAMAVILVLTRDLPSTRDSRTNIKRGLIFVFISVIGGAVASISSKFAAVSTDKMAFIAVSYTMATLFSFALKEKFQTEESNTNHRDAVLIGIIMGVINLAGYYAFLAALSTGPLSIIASIGGMHFVIATVLSRLIYKEKLTHRRIFGLFLTILSIILLRR